MIDLVNKTIVGKMNKLRDSDDNIENTSALLTAFCENTYENDGVHDIFTGTILATTSFSKAKFAWERNHVTILLEAPLGNSLSSDVFYSARSGSGGVAVH